jgi:hypothetical protein
MTGGFVLGSRTTGGFVIGGWTTGGFVIGGWTTGGFAGGRTIEVAPVERDPIRIWVFGQIMG